METNNNTEHDNEEKFLSFISKQNNFSVPQNYFDYLPDEIVEKIRLRSNQKEKFFLFKPIISIPSFAVLSCMVVLLFFFYHKNIVPSDEMILSENEVQQVIDNPELYDIDETSVAEQYLASNISYETANEEATISDEEIKTYLEENNDVTNLLTSENNK